MRLLNILKFCLEKTLQPILPQVQQRSLDLHNKTFVICNRFFFLFQNGNFSSKNYFDKLYRGTSANTVFETLEKQRCKQKTV